MASGAIVGAPHVIAQPRVQWRMSTAWSPVLDNLQGAALLLAKLVEETSGGRFRIEVFAGGCACGSSGAAVCGAGGAMAWERGRGEGVRGRGGR